MGDGDKYAIPPFPFFEASPLTHSIHSPDLNDIPHRFMNQAWRSCLPSSFDNMSDPRWHELSPPAPPDHLFTQLVIE